MLLVLPLLFTAPAIDRLQVVGPHVDLGLDVPVPLVRRVPDADAPSAVGDPVTGVASLPERPETQPRLDRLRLQREAIAPRHGGTQRQQLRRVLVCLTDRLVAPPAERAGAPCFVRPLERVVRLDGE